MRRLFYYLIDPHIFIEYFNCFITVLGYWNCDYWSMYLQLDKQC